MNLSRILSSLFVPRKSAFKKCGVAAFWLLATLGRTAGASEPLRVTISVPLAEGAYRASTGAEDRSIVYVDAKATCFYILVTNVSENSQRIWRDGSPWGYDDLMFELTAEKGEKVAVIKPLTGFTMSIPAWWVLAAGETHVFAIYFADPEEWVGFPLLPAGSQQVYTVRAFYKSNESPESKQYGIWHGEIASDSIRVSFYNAGEAKGSGKGVKGVSSGVSSYFPHSAKRIGQFGVTAHDAVYRTGIRMPKGLGAGASSSSVIL